MYKLESKAVKGLSPLTINRIAENKMRVYPYGYTYQATSTQKDGDNIFDYSKWYVNRSNIIVPHGTINVGQNSITLSSPTKTDQYTADTFHMNKDTPTENQINVVKKYGMEIKSSTQYTLSFSNPNKVKAQCFIFWYKEDYSYISANSSAIGSIERHYLTTTAPANAKYMCIRFDNESYGGSNTTLIIQNIAVKKGTNTDYSAFVPNSPSPDYPSRIRNLGDNINIFDGELEVGAISTSTGKETSNSARIRSKNFIPIIPSTSYIMMVDNVAFAINKMFYDSDYNFISVTTSALFTTPSNARYMKFYGNNNTGTNDINDKTIKIERGSTPTPYTPYNCGSADFKITGKNKIKINDLESTTNNGITYSIKDGVITLNGTATSSTTIVFKESRFTPELATYTFSSNFEGSVSGLVGQYIYQYNNTNKIIINYGKIEEAPKTKAITSNTEGMYGIWLNSGAVLNNVKLKPQLELGSNSTSFQKYYEEQLVSFPFTEGQVLHKGDYLASDGIHQKRKTIVFDGTENWKMDYGTSLFDYSIENQNTNNIAICNSYKFNTRTAGMANLVNGEFAKQPKYSSIFFKNTNYTTKEQWKAYLATQYANGTPVTVEYELAEEIVIPYTAEQEYVLNHIYSYEEVTNIFSIDEFDFEMEVIYTPQFLPEIKDKFIKGPTFGRIHILDTDENFTQDNYLKDFSVSELRFVPDKGLFGGCVAKKVDVNFNNVNKQFSIQDKEFEAYLGVDYEDERYEIKYGTFIVQHPETEDTTDNTSFTALDYMIKFNQKYIDYVTYPCTLRDIAESICNQAGLTLAEETFRNEDFIVENNQFVNGENLRQVLQGIALSAFSWARVDENNELHFDLNQKEDIDIELTPDKYYNLSKDDYIYGPINRIIIRDSQIEGENVTIEDKESIEINGITELVIEDNPFAYTQEKRQELIEAAKELFGFRYMPVNDVSLIGFAFLNSKDKIRFTTLEGNVFDTYLFDHIINYNGTILDTMQSKALTKTETKYIYKPDITQAIKNTQIIVDKANQTINQIIEKQDEQSSQLVNIETDLSGVHTTIQDNQKDIEEKINEIEQSIEGTKQTLTYKGGNNIFYYAKEFWNNGTEGGTANLEEYTDTEIQQKSISGNGYIINKGTSEQKNVVKNDTYTISFTYKKLIDLATGYVEINGTRINLTSTNWKEEVITEIIDTNTIDIKIVSDTANAFKIFDLMGTIGNEKQVWTQNPNETRTDTVTIGRGIQVNSSTKNTYARFDADGNRIYNSSTNEVVTELTDKGVDTDKVTADVGQVGGILIQVIDGQTWFSSLL